MTAITFDYLAGLDTIPPFKEVVETLRKKYGYPLKYFNDPTSNTGGRPGVTEEFYKEFTVLSSNIIEYLKKEFPVETTDGKLFNVQLPPRTLFNPGNPFSGGLESWIGAQTKPEPHYGYPGCQWFYETSNTGRVAKTVPTLLSAYTMCVSARKVRLEKESKAKAAAEAKEKALAEAKAKADAEKKVKRIAYEKKVSHYTKLLCDSLEMHYFPERIVKGVRKPARWLPDFNCDLVSAVKREFGDEQGARLIDSAYSQSREKGTEMLVKFQKEQEEKRWIEEERKATILARAMVLAQSNMSPQAVARVEPVETLHVQVDSRVDKILGTNEDPQ